MPTDHRERLARIRRFDQLVAYLRDELGWPIDSDDFEELTFEYTPEELGIDAKNAAKIQEIKRLRPLSASQPWGVFFVKFEPKRLPVVALRRILGQVTLKKRASASESERQAWAPDDLLFVSNYGEGKERRIAFAHFSNPQDGHDLPTLRVLGWDNLDTPLHLDAVARELTEHLTWPADEDDTDAWRKCWRAAFKLRHLEVITTSKQLSERLAELARTIRDRTRTALDIEAESGPLTKLMKAFQTALVHDLDDAGFADMYAQTIAYGLLSARITDPARRTADDLVAHVRTNPFLKELMETFRDLGGRRAKAGGISIDFDELGVSEVVELLDHSNMEAVVRDFGDRNPKEDPVIHFYEHFLSAYDKNQKVSRGVFYTPRPVVSYLVRSVDEMLRSEFGLTDGLADTTTWGAMAKRHKELHIPEGIPSRHPFVQILDPATGTGTFLVEVIDLIHKTMVDKWTAQSHSEERINVLWNDYVANDLLSRLHGYELLMAPYAIAHLKIGLKLYETGYRFDRSDRARVYLTNALEAPGREQLTFNFLPALAHEAAAVNEIKRNQRFTVVVGNPPYSKISSNLTPAMRAIVERYRYLGGEKIRERGALQFEINLQDDYVKFFRLCEQKVLASSVGVLGLITNNGYLTTPTLRGMRDSLLETFNSIWAVDLHGHLAKGETGPDEGREENVFDIVQGVSLFLGQRTSIKTPDSSVFYSEQYGTRIDKYSFLRDNTRTSTNFAEIQPMAPFHLFIPHDAELTQEWEQFVSLTEVFIKNSAGIITSRDALVIAEDKCDLADRVERFSRASGEESAVYEEFGFSKSKRFDLRRAQADLNDIDSFVRPIRRILHRPFDERFIFFHSSVVWSLSRPVADQLATGKNLALLATRQVTRPKFEHAFVSRHMIEIKACSHDRNTQVFPLFFNNNDDARVLQARVTPNINPRVYERLAMNLKLRIEKTTEELGEESELAPLRIFQFIYAVLHSVTYRGRYFEFLRSEFPRIPPVANRDVFLELVRLGGELVAVHLMESTKLIKFVTRWVGNGTAQVERVSYSAKTVWLDKARTQGFSGVEEEVWNFRIGGYQVCHKWLKDRKGRALSDGELTHYQRIVVGLSETVRIMGEIDAVIEAHGGWPEAFQVESRINAVSDGTARVVPFRPLTVEPAPEERYVTCVPLVELKAAAGGFSDPQYIEDGDFKWVAVESHLRLRKGMFVAQVVGKSMEPRIPDGSWCLFRAPVEGTRQGKTVLVQLRDDTDPETGQRYTVKRYESEKAEEDPWRHVKITLRPVNLEFKPIVLTSVDGGELQVIAELFKVLERDDFVGGD